MSGLGKTWTFLSVYYAHMLEYRAEIILWMFAGVFPFILMGVWMKAGESGQFALSSVEFGRYFLSVFIVRQMSVVWVIWEFEGQVVGGQLSPFLLQPIDPVWRFVARHVSERFTRAPFVVVLLIGFFACMPGLFWIPSFSTACLGFLAMVAAFAVRFLIQYTFAMLCFWTERASSVQGLWFLVYMFLSGLIAPLEVFPEGVREVALWTPFPYLVDFPARLIMGSQVELAWGFAMLGIWGGVFFLINRFMWKRGLKHYSGMGA